MTWHTLFNFSTMENRHLLGVYATVFAVQGGYFVWTAWRWRHTKKPRD